MDERKPPPKCPDCAIEGKPFWTTKAQLYGIPDEDVLDNPALAIPFPTGEWYCPGCKRLLIQT